MNKVLPILLLATAANALPRKLAALPDPIFSADRYPTGTEECAWLNWIGNRQGMNSLEEIKSNLTGRVESLGMSTWESLGVPAATIKQITTYMAGNTMNCSRDERSAPPYSCEGLSDVGCQFSDFNSVIFNKTDGAVASPPNHKVIAENDQIRVINVYCPLNSIEYRFHTHTRLSFWMSYGVSRGEAYYGYNGSKFFDEPLWDGKEKSSLKVMWNGPEWFHMIEEKEPLNSTAPGNCPVDVAPACDNGWKYRIELKFAGETGLDYVRVL